MVFYLALLAGALLVLFTMYVNIDTLIGAFGDGPPYYGRTTNMDKWENPIPKLVALDAVAVIILWMVGRWAVRCRKR
ncbi:hypothetical protein JK151_16540 (plasmid) [Ralstonia syzygii subsp. celebesensis]|nr:hypothetical protein JK151_16540 [Ralstonia syzygii subsp. celebesensis]QUP55403.1 hypothetical protein GO998_06135 [Ralstonia syzygii]BEU71625.1 hypothetical protein MAFF211271_11800 [Ralstonia pseudosolanacearum]